METLIISRLNAIMLSAFICLLCAGVHHPAAHAQERTSVRIAVPSNLNPLYGVDFVGNPEGAVVDIWRTWSEKTGVDVTFVSGTWEQTLEFLEDGRADIHGGMIINQRRAELFDFSSAIMDLTSRVFVWWARGVPDGVNDLRGRAVGAIKGSNQARRLASHYPEIRVREFTRHEDMLLALARGEVAAAAGEAATISHQARRNSVQSKIAEIPEDFLYNSLHAAVRKGELDLLAMVDWGLSLITLAELSAIKDTWFADVPPARARPSAKIRFTELEKEWLKNNPVITIGMLSGQPPISYLDADGHPTGMSPAFVDLLNRRLDGRIRIEPGQWADLLRRTKTGELDGLLNITPVKRRFGSYRFTRPYLEIPYGAVTVAGAPEYRTLNGLKGLSVAIEEGFGTAGFLKAAFPSIELREYPDTLESLKAVARGEANAYLGNLAVSRRLIKDHPDALGALHAPSRVIERDAALAIGTPLDKLILRDILDKAVASISLDQRMELAHEWIGEEGIVGVRLSPDERAWLIAHSEKPVRVHIDQWPPFHFMEDGEPKGLAYDYVVEALHHLGLEAEAVPATWSQGFNNVAQSRGVDILPTIARSPEREEMFSITNDYLSFPMAIFGPAEGPLITELEDLHGKTVAVEDGFIMQRLLSRDHPDIKLMTTPNTLDAIEAVSSGDADAYVGNLGSGGYHIERYGFSNVKVAAPTVYANDAQAMGVRKDWPELTSMLNKVLDSFTQEEHARLRQTNLAILLGQGVDYTAVIQYATAASVVFLTILSVILVSNRKLQTEIAERRNAETRLKEREEWFRSLLESAPDATIIVNSEGRIVQINRQAEILFGYDRKDLLGKQVEELIPDDMRRKHTAYRGSFVAASAPRVMAADTRLTARKKSGDLIPVEISLSPIENADGMLVAAAVRDISERRAQEEVLAEKEAQLTAAMENMSGAMFMVDKDLKIRVFNRKFAELYKLPEVCVGMPLEDILRIRAIRGEYGPGDPEPYVAERLKSYRDGSITRVEDVILGKTIVEGFRQPTTDGGIVCVFNDITIRRKAEDALAAQRRQLENLSNKLSRYLSPQIYEAIFAGAADVQVRTERKKLTVFFSDIKNFTATTEEMEPEDMTFLLNDYLTKMTEIALEHGGTIDKYVGDAIIVFFGDPETKGVKQDALAAVNMAVAMQRRMVDLRAKWADMGYLLPFHIRCGVNTGYCNVGNFGSEQRIDYTIIGGEVNLAARLESICDVDGVTISYETYSHVRDEIDAAPLKPIHVKGIKGRVKPYSVRGVLENWNPASRYIRKDVQGLRLWIDLMRMTEQQRLSNIGELQTALNILRGHECGAEDPTPDAGANTVRKYAG